MADVSRREFLGTVAAAVVVGAISNNSRAQATGSGPLTRLSQFNYGEVKLTAGPLKDQFDHTLKYYMALDEDRVLKPYRQLAQQDAPGADMGGWYNVGAFAAGHALGQWISALSRFYAATGDAQIHAKIERLVDGYAKTLTGTGNFFVGHRFPAYCYDKLVLGLTEAFQLAGLQQSREILSKTTDRAIPALPEKALTRQEQAARPHKDMSYTFDESYTMPENLFYAHEVFGDARYLEMAKRYLHDKPYFDPLSRGENVLPGLHAYSHVNCLSSAARAYLALGDEKYLKAIQNAWEMLEKIQWFASGGWGPNEAFVKPGEGGLGESLTHTHNHFETPCGSYAHFKLARYLMRITGDSQYGDGLERMLYNGILAAKEMGPDGRTFYYSDYSPLTRKGYHPDAWPCCSGTYPQVVADYLVSAYFHDDAGIYVNLYVPSEVRWGNVLLTQETQYPEKSGAKFTIGLKEPREISLRFRLPMWADAMMQMQINGKPEPMAADGHAGRFVEVKRTWNNGDTVEVMIPLRYRQEAIDDKHPDLAAIMRGPVMMVTVAEMPAGVHISADHVQVDGGSRVVPFFRVKDEPYTTYLRNA